MYRTLKSAIYLILICTLTHSCDVETDQVAQALVLEEILLVSGERASVTARLLGNEAVAILDHGFEFDTDESFNNPVTITLGAKEVPGKFIGLTSDLEFKTDYKYRAYVQLEGETIYSDVRSLRTLAIEIDSFEPQIGRAGGAITITGSNFSEETVVCIGGVQAEIRSIFVETVMTVVIPPLRSEYVVDIEVKAGEDKLTFDRPFEYVIGSWDQVGTFPNSDFFKLHTFMASDEEAIFGQGVVNNAQGPFTSKMYHRDIRSGEWTELNFPGAPGTGRFATWPYFGSGTVVRGSDEAQTTDFWKFDNGAFSQQPALPFKSIYSAAMTSGDDLFVFGGLDTMLNPHLNINKMSGGQWSLIGRAPFAIWQQNPFVERNGLFYFLLNTGNLWSYNPQSDEWNRLAAYPSTVSQGGVNVIYKDHWYLGLGDNSRGLWEYDFEEDFWREKNLFTGSFNETSIGSWVENDLIYVLRSKTLNIQSGNMSIWSFDPTDF